MSEDNKWEIFHDYTRAIDKNLIEPLHCPNDDMEIFVRANKDFEPIFYCYFCESSFQVGLNILSRLKEALKSA